MDNFQTVDPPDDWQAFLNRVSSMAEVSEDVKRMKNVKSLKEKVEICYNKKYDYGLKKWLQRCLQRPIAAKKSSVAEKFRLKGNEHMKNNNKALALSCYNKSLFYAPKDSDQMRSAYGNRSYLLLEMNHYVECVQDVDRALNEDDISLRQLKLLSRKGQALVAQNKYSEAMDNLEKAISLHKNLHHDLQRKAQKEITEITLLTERIKNECSKNHKLISSNSDNAIMKIKPNLNFVENSNFASASKTISLMSNESKGRYVIANEDVYVGDVLFVERPFAFVVLPEMADKYCNYCCKAVYAPIPCESCPLACFCNESCRNLTIFHQWECGGLEICYSIGIVHLALRVALLGLPDENKDKYKEVMGLVSHIYNSNDSDVFSYALTAALLTIYLEDYTNLFEGPERREKLLDFGGAILLHIAQLICNGHAITDIESQCDSDSSLLIENQVRVATAIYPSASMMNHSCDPTIINSFFDSLLIVRASKDLKKGEEVYNCYGPMVQKMSYRDRQELLLSQYKFVCDCVSCSKKIGPVSDTIICEHCSAQLMLRDEVCSSCSGKLDTQSLSSNLNSAGNHFNEGLNLLNDGKFLESCDYLKKSLLLYQKHCHKNHQKILECRDSLARAYANIDKEEEACRYIIQNIKCIEDMYGKTAVEVGQEILKLITVATNLTNKYEKNSLKDRKILGNCIQLGKRGKFILELSFGNWHPRYKDFCKHLDYLCLHV